MDQNSDPWLKARLGILTASEVQSLITPGGDVANNNDSRAIVFTKVGERITGQIEESYTSKHMERGNIFEPFARDLYVSERNPVKECGFVTRQFEGFKIGYSTDGLVGDDGLIEIKCPAQAKHIKEICLETEPTAYMMQMQTGMLVTGREWCDYIAHYNGMNQRIVRVLSDSRIQEKILLAAKNLEECIEINTALYHENSQGMPKSNYIEGVSV